jgi:serine/threonine protein kinase/Tol biopolymer transport system component
MPLADGTRLEHYEIAGPLGAGGMGEVYRAVDTKLRREVALKILPPKFAADPSRLARFEREAHLLAQLNHPNIAAIYGLENADGIRFLVLELVEGPTLAERLKSGPMEVSEALGIAAQIAEAFEAAHDKGVVHRDLKPANVKITPQGKVKVLDFGLAKALGDTSDPPAEAGATSLSTMTLQETRAGMVMGTAAYMSPEQAEGKPIDKRSDVWSFGVVLYEMLSGKRCFDGKTTSHIMLKLLEQEPDYTKLPDSVPQGVRYVLERCLQKDPAKRLRDVGDLRLQLEALAQDSGPGHKTAAATPSARAQRNAVWPAATAALALAVLALGFLYFRPKPAPPLEITRFEIPQPPNLTFSSSLALSPDGRKLAFIASASANLPPQLWIRSMDAVEARPLPGTEGASGGPFWSPDSRFIVFWAQNKVQKIEAAGGPAQTLCTSVASILGGFWTPDDKVVFGVNRPSGLLQVSAAGGEPSPVTTLTSGEARHTSPTLLPDGRHFVFAGFLTPTTGGIYLGSLDAKPNQPVKKLLPDVSTVQFAPALGGGDGHLLFVRAGTLMAQPFDTKRLELSGQAVPIAEQVAISAFSNFSAAPTGSLAYRTGGGAGQQQLTWYDRQGKTLGTVSDPYVYGGTSAPVLSPDGKRVAFTRTEPQSGNTDIWLFEFARGVTTRFTFDPGVDQNPVWSPDGSRILFVGQRGGAWGVYQKASNLVGGEELVYKSGDVPVAPTSWSRDGKYVLYQTGGAGVWALPMEGTGERKPIQLLPPEFNNRGARFSPDGRYFSYLSTESGRDETYVRTFDPTAGAGSTTGGKWMVSKDGGGGAHWRADGKEMLYFAPDLTLMSVDVSTSPVFQAGVPKALFKSSVASIYWESTGDAQRFLLPVAVGANIATPYTVVMNWTALLKR